jgi:F-box-like
VRWENDTHCSGRIQGVRNLVPCFGAVNTWCDGEELSYNPPSRVPPTPHDSSDAQHVGEENVLAGILDLPNELLLRIFQYLPYGTRRHVLPLVCNRFNEIVRDLDHNVEVRVFDGSELGGLTTRDLLRTFSGHRRVTVKSIHVEGQRCASFWLFRNSGGVLLSLSWENLKLFNMTGFFRYWDLGLFVAAAREGRLRTVEHVVLQLGWSFNCEDLLGWDLPYLRSLEVETGLGHRRFFELPGLPFHAMERLRRVKIFWIPMTQSVGSDKPFSRFLSLVIPSWVSELFVDTCQNCDFALWSLSCFPNVTSFGISFSMLSSHPKQTIASDLLQAFPNLDKLIVHSIPVLPINTFANRLGDVILNGLKGGWRFVVTKTVVVFGEHQVLSGEFVR